MINTKLFVQGDQKKNQNHYYFYKNIWVLFFLFFCFFGHPVFDRNTWNHLTVQKKKAQAHFKMLAIKFVYK